MQFNWAGTKIHGICSEIKLTSDQSQITISHNLKTDVCGMVSCQRGKNPAPWGTIIQHSTWLAPLVSSLISKTTKAIHFQFGAHVHTDHLSITNETKTRKGQWSRSRDPLHFWALNANCSKMVKGTDFKHVPKYGPDMTP